MKRFAAVITILMLCSNVHATVVSFDIGFIFEGPGLPTNASPWVNAEFDDGGTPGTVDLTISALGLTIDEKLSKIWFNLDTALVPGDLSFGTPTTGSFDAPVISTGVDSFQADGDGLYDILLTFDTNGPIYAFNGGDTIQYTISLSGLTASSFNFPSKKDGGAGGEYLVAAHLLSLGIEGDSAHATVPEPATIVLFGLGGLGLIRKRRA